MSYDLNIKNMHKLSNAIQTPAYDPNSLKACIAHLGVGNFFRSHLADYTQDAIDEQWQVNENALNWGIQAIDLRTPKITDALARQDHLYLLNKRDNNTLERKIIGSITNSCFSSYQPEQCINILTAAETRILTLTITEKGYYYNANTQQLNRANKEIQSDLLNWEKYGIGWTSQQPPQTTLGWITAACIIRKENNTAPLVILSCDNLLQNGKTIQQAVYQFMQINDPTLADWFIENVCCLSSMVDRITPAISKQTRDHYSKKSNLNDAAPVVCEPFKQWVIEKPQQDELLDIMPKWEKSGALWVESVEPFEQVKLQILNALHSTLAYIGVLCGHHSIADCMRDPMLLAYAKRCLTEDILPTITPPKGLDLNKYSNTILERFANDSLNHLSTQVAMDGSQKIPLRWIPTIEKNLDKNKKPKHLLLAITAWSLYLRPDIMGLDKQESWEIHDPLKHEFQQIAQSSDSSAHDWIEYLLSKESIFPNTISCNITVKNTIKADFQEIAEATMKKYLNKHYGN